MKDLKEEKRLKKVVDFLFEAGMLKKTPRTGFQFLGTGKESVAEHSFRTAIIGYVLAKIEGADWKKVLLMCLFHDFHEARTGDFNYVNRMYNRSDEIRAFKDALCFTGIEDEIISVIQELNSVSSYEAVLAHDADQLDLILTLKEEYDLGNKYAMVWIEYAIKRLRSDIGKKIAELIKDTDHTDWWFKGVDPSWWAKKNGQKE